MVLLLVACLWPASGLAQTPIDTGTRDALRWSEGRTAADWIGTGLVAGALVVPCVRDRTWRCVGNEAVQVGIGVGVAELSKLLVHRTRPDASDRKSFFSEHTTLACAVTIRTKAWAVCPAVGYLRIAADKHWLTDVGTGAVAGALLAQVTW